MATKIFPSTNDVNAGVSGQGKTLTEANMIAVAACPYFGKSYVKSGAAGSNGGGLNLNVALGVYMIGGYYVSKTATETVALNASTTNYVWLQLTVDGSNNVTGTQWVVRTSTGAPSGAASVLVNTGVTGGSTITTITDSWRGVISPGGVVGYNSYTTNIGTTGVVTSFAAPGDGLTDMWLEGGCALNANVSSGSPRVDLVDGSTALSQGLIYFPGTGIYGKLHMAYKQAAFAGSKTLGLYLRTTSGSVIVAAADNPAYVRATWHF